MPYNENNRCKLKPCGNCLVVPYMFVNGMYRLIDK